VGETVPRTVSVRVIAATNRELEDAVRAGRFREDLYYRLHVVRIDVPPLRERPEDIPVLVAHFLSRFNKEHEADIGIDDDARAMLYAYEYPGNVRQLKHLVERLAVMSNGRIRAQDLQAELGGIVASDSSITLVLNPSALLRRTQPGNGRSGNGAS
jgi:DNA-binding NtrC family response regulator